MKTTLLASALLSTTVAAVALYRDEPNPVLPIQGDPPPKIAPVIPPAANEKPVIEAVFVLDTTGSMSGLIQAAKEKIWSIASSMAQGNPTPELRIGFVAYRDRGDAYVTQVTDLSADLDMLYATLMDYQAGGGGDTPESVNQALFEAVNSISWSQNDGAYQVVFLVGDAPPHMDYQDDVKYPQSLARARERGIVINTIQCGQQRQTTDPWIEIAQLGNGRFFEVEQAGSAIVMTTPYDERLASLSKQLDATRLYYGDRETKAKQDAKIAATEKLEAGSSIASKARRAAFNAAPAGKTSFLGIGELVDDVASGRVELDHIDEEKLPEPLRALAPAERENVVKEQAEKRDRLTNEIQALAQQRDDYLKEKVAETGEAEESLDHKLFDAVKEQAAAAGIEYRSSAPVY